MCGSARHRLLGMRLNASQGLRLRAAEGIAVSVKRCADCDLIFADPQRIPGRFPTTMASRPMDIGRQRPLVGRPPTLPERSQRPSVCCPSRSGWPLSTSVLGLAKRCNRWPNQASMVGASSRQNHSMIRQLNSSSLLVFNSPRLGMLSFPKTASTSSPSARCWSIFTGPRMPSPKRLNG